MHIPGERAWDDPPETEDMRWAMVRGVPPGALDVFAAFIADVHRQVRWRHDATVQGFPPNGPLDDLPDERWFLELRDSGRRLRHLVRDVAIYAASRLDPGVNVCQAPRR